MHKCARTRHRVSHPHAQQCVTNANAHDRDAVAAEAGRDADRREPGAANRPIMKDGNDSRVELIYPVDQTVS
jgi:hypothetical protein